MTTYAVFAVHAFSNGIDPPQPVLRTQSKDTAERILHKLKKERFTESGKKLKRYSSVFIQETEQ